MKDLLKVNLKDIVAVYQNNSYINNIIIIMSLCLNVLINVSFFYLLSSTSKQMKKLYLFSDLIIVLDLVIFSTCLNFPNLCFVPIYVVNVTHSVIFK